MSEVRLIDANALIAEVKSLPNDNPSYIHSCDVIDRDMIIDTIDNAPTIVSDEAIVLDFTNITEEQKQQLVNLLSKTRIKAINNDVIWQNGYDACLNDKSIRERPKEEWIPVSERLPEEKINPMTNDFELVLCSTVWEDVRPYKFGKPIGHDKPHFWLGGGIMDEYVIAWQYKPEPYKEIENE